jgi:GT2 family glycosyltransferase
MNYSIVVIAYKKLQNLINCIHDAFNSSLPPTEFIVIVNPYDKDETSKILDYVKNEPKITRWVYMSQNVGVATAWNLGMAISNSEYIVVLNDDCRVGPTTYENMILEFSDSDVGVVGVKWGGYIQDAAPTPQGFLIAYKKSMIKNIGGYSEKSSPLADEREFCLRALANGYIAKVANNCSWHHIHDISNHPNTVIKYLGNDWIPDDGVPKYQYDIKELMDEYNTSIIKRKNNIL